LQRYLIHILIILSPFSVLAQKKIQLLIKSDSSGFINKIQTMDSTEILPVLEGYSHKGYKADTIFDNHSFLQLYLFKNVDLDIIKMERSSVPQTVLPDNLSGKDTISVQLNDLSFFLNSIIDKASWYGYPLAEVYLDSILSSTGLNARLLFNPGPLIRFDSISVSGAGRIKKRYLVRILEIQPGTIFDSRKLNYPDWMKGRVDYFKFNQPPQVNFYGEKAVVDFNLKKVNNSQIDGLIGLQQVNRKNQVTGFLELHLNNLFLSGKRMDLSWNRFSFQQQLLNVNYIHTAFIKKNIELQLNFNIYKQDTGFQSRNAGLLLRHVGLKNNFSTDFYYNSFYSDPLTGLSEMKLGKIRADKYGIRIINGLPSQLFDAGKRFYFFLSLEFSGKTVFDSAKTSKYPHLELQSRTEKFFKMNKNFSIGISISSALQSSRKLFYNEYFMLGGYRNLRGFPENFFRTPAYSILKLEGNAHTNGNLVFIAFSEFAILKKPDKPEINTAFSIATGLRIKIKSGIFQLIYALGKNGEAPHTTNSRIHFGVTSLF
jgi:translocation and assembly module TamA